MPWVEQDALAQDEFHHAASVFLKLESFSWVAAAGACPMGLPHGFSCAAPGAAGMRNFNGDLVYPQECAQASPGSSSETPTKMFMGLSREGLNGEG